MAGFASAANRGTDAKSIKMIPKDAKNEQRGKLKTTMRRMTMMTIKEKDEDENDDEENEYFDRDDDKRKENDGDDDDWGE